ncbi:MAG TPA: HNH endonuclease [Gemmatimonadales bacterium]
MRIFVGVTDTTWFNFLASRHDIVELNFWQPAGNRRFRALSPGELFVFKLKAPHNVIAGGGFLAHSSLLPVSLAWEAFGEKNGFGSYMALRERIARYRGTDPGVNDDFTIGCIILQNPFFLPPEHWIPVPDDFASGVVVGKGYTTDDAAGARLFEQVQERMHLGWRTHLVSEPERPESPSVHFTDAVSRRRLGQGTFRVLVTDVYERRCAVSGERTLPVLQAAHIQPVSRGGVHALGNGLLLRSDIHTLFDRGYIGVTPDLRVRVSHRLKQDFDNGRIYYQHDGALIRVPSDLEHQPLREMLEWHADTIFLK